MYMTEKAGINHHRKMYGIDVAQGTGPSLITAKENGVVDKSINYISDHRWTMLGVTWLSGISGSIWYMYRQKGLNWTQRIVQARMYAQALTIIGILATAGVASLSSRNTENTRVQRHMESRELQRILQNDDFKPTKE